MTQFLQEKLYMIREMSGRLYIPKYKYNDLHFISVHLFSILKIYTCHKDLLFLS